MEAGEIQSDLSVVCVTEDCRREEWTQVLAEGRVGRRLVDDNRLIKGKSGEGTRGQITQALRADVAISISSSRKCGRCR